VRWNFLPCLKTVGDMADLKAAARNPRLDVVQALPNRHVQHVHHLHQPRLEVILERLQARVEFRSQR
jgi:hypothetical protein